MTRFALLLAALLVPLSSSAQGLWASPDDEWDITDGPPILQGDLSNEADMVTSIGDSMRDLASGDLAWGPIWWLATTFSPHIPVDPKCPPPDGCADPEGDEPPAGGETPEGDPPPGGETPTGGETPDSEEASVASSSRGVETISLGRRADALAFREQFRDLAEGQLVPDAVLPNGARLRLVSKRETDRNDPAEYQLRFETLPRRRSARPARFLVQAGDGVVLARLEQMRRR